MVENDNNDINKILDFVNSTEGKTISTLDTEGEFPLLLIFPDKKHVKYIEKILEPLETNLFKKDYSQFKTIRISDETLCDEHFGKSFEKWAEECIAAIVIFDGGRPNVWYEYGFLRGKGKPLVLLQSEHSFINIKAFYQYKYDKKVTGLTEKQFEDLKNPPLGYFSHFSNKAGVKVLTVDWEARFGDNKHTYTVVKDYMKKLWVR